MTAAAPRGASKPPVPKIAPMNDIGGEDNNDWGVPTNLVAPPPLPGMVQRWVRISLRGEDHAGNLAKHEHLGWTPRPADTVSDTYASMKKKDGTDGAGVIRVHDMVLMQIPEARYEARSRYIAQRTEIQTSSIEGDLLKVERPGVSFEQTRRTRIGGGNGRIPAVRQDDDDI